MIEKNVEAKKTKLRNVKIEKEYMNNSNIANSLTKKPLEKDTVYSALAFYNGNHPIYTLFSLSHDVTKCPQIEMPYQISPFDMAVMDSVYTLAQNGITEFSIDGIARAMSADMTQKISKQRRQQIMKSMNRLKYLRVTINYTKEYNCNHEKKQRRVALESYLMPVSEIDAVSANGRDVLHAYKLLATPALYAFAEIKGQIISVPAEVFQAMGVVQDTEESVVLKRYLIQRIAMMKNSNNNVSSNKISFQWNDYRESDPEAHKKGLYAALGYHPEDYTARSWEKKKATLNNTIKNLLQALSQIGFISGFQEYRVSSKNGTEKKMDYETHIHTGTLSYGGYYIET